MNVAVKTGSSAAVGSRRIRVMIVDDAVVVRAMFSRWVEAEPDLQVVAALRSGREAVDQLDTVKPDVVVLDVEMPDLDGIAALPLLLQKKRDLVVIMASTLTRRNAEISLRALALGAADYIPKPQSSQVDPTSLFRRELIEKIRGLGARARQVGAAAAKPRTVIAPEIDALAKLPQLPRSPPLAPKGPARSLRAFPIPLPRVLAIGASTGGPQALTSLMRQLGPVIDRAPVLITQHMPPTFTTILAEHIGRVAGRPAQEARDGQEINARNIYIAPGGKHMKVVRRDGIAVIELDEGPMINFCKPAVDPMFASAAAVWGHWVLGLILTGMGSDGLNGSRSVVSAGGAVIAQDEASSVVWGMPGQVAQAGLASAILPLDQIASAIGKLFAGERP
jgi:two-component system chemotaxis response regulator CheB